MGELADHWERVYSTGGAHSWDQDEPRTTLGLLKAADVGPATSVIDVGGALSHSQ